jgi:lipoprotein-anchoring transpeptidase ErfK/SrfK
MVILDAVEVDVAKKQICLVSTQRECHPVSVGCPSTPTIPGIYKVSTIYTNPIPRHPKTGKLYSESKLGGYVISLEGTTMALHGWDKQSEIGQACSMSCIRIPQPVIEDLIFKYLFNQITIY